MKKRILKNLIISSFLCLFSLITLNLHAEGEDGWVYTEVTCWTPEGFPYESWECDEWGGNCNTQICCEDDYNHF